MAKFEKASLYPNQLLCGVDGMGQRVYVEYSTQDIDALLRRLKEMLSHNVQIPVSWDHQPDARLLSLNDYNRMLAEHTRLICGHVTDGYIGSDGSLVLLTDVKDEDANTIQKVKFASPTIEQDVVDGTGKLWPGLSITQLAVTPRPVQHKQNPFQRIDLGRKHKQVHLSLGVPMADEDYEKDDMDTMPEDEGMEDDVDIEETDDMPAMPEEPGSDIAEILDELKNHDIHLAPGVDKNNFIEHLHTALMTKRAHQGEDMDMGGEDELDGGAMDDTGLTEETTDAPIMLSLRRENKMLRERNDSLYASIVADKRKTLLKRLGKLEVLRDTDKATYERLEKSLKTVNLSLSPKGKIESNPTLIELQTYEKVLSNKELAQKLNGNLGRGLVEINQPKHVQLSRKPGESPDKDELIDEEMDKLTKGQWSAQKRKNQTKGA